METNQTNNQKENVDGETFTRHSHSKSQAQGDVLTGSRRRNNIVKRLVLQEEEAALSENVACGKEAAVEVNHTHVVKDARQPGDDDDDVKNMGAPNLKWRRAVWWRR